MNYFMRETHLQANSSEWVYQETLYSKWGTYWVRSVKRITRINCSTQTVRYVKITSKWISEIQQCFWSTQQPYGRIQYLKSQLLGNNILAFTFNFCIDFIDFIFLCFYHHLCNYCNRVFSDQSSNAACRCLYRGCCYFNMYKTNQSTGSVYNDSEVTIKVKEDIRSCYAKYVFLQGKINNVIVSLVLLGLFTDRNDAFSYPFIYFS